MVIVILLTFGLFHTKDYGIGVDEEPQRRTGLINVIEINKQFNYFLKSEAESRKYNLPVLATYKDKIYGPVFEILLVGIEVMLKLKDPYQIHQMRHIMTFLFFVAGVWVFYKISLYHFKDDLLALIGGIFLILSPRIFAHAFYNSKDIIFLVFYIFSIYTGLNYLRKPDYKNAGLHGLFSALLIATRITGLIVPFATMIILILQLIQNYSKEKLTSSLLTSLIYAAITSFFTILFWPYLWNAPWQNLSIAFAEMSKFGWPGSVLFEGKILDGDQIPWSYSLIWMLITIPVLYIILFLVGFFITSFQSIKYMLKVKWQSLNLELLFILSLFIGPLLSIIALKAVIYDGWRHLFFIYAPFLLISLEGLRQVLLAIKKKKFRTYLKAGLAVYFLFILIKIVSLHPFQMVYFNEVSSLNYKKGFDQEYWGTSYKKGYERLLQLEEDTIKVYQSKKEATIEAGLLSGLYLKLNSYAIKDKDRNRIKLCKDWSEADYFLTNYRETYYNPEAFEKKYSLGDDQEIYAIIVDNVKIFAIYKLKI
ncbi:MAG: hypothetical protein ACNS62_07950 [Candidatus Cyclobacteriaceae bacterium M3_2C_046]